LNGQKNSWACSNKQKYFYCGTVFERDSKIKLLLNVLFESLFIGGTVYGRIKKDKKRKKKISCTIVVCYYIIVKKKQYCLCFLNTSTLVTGECETLKISGLVQS